MATDNDATRRHNTFINGIEFINNHSDTVDKLYAAVMADIVTRSFDGTGWIVDTKNVDRTTVLVPIFTSETTKHGLPFAISKFDTKTSPASEPAEKHFTMTLAAMSDFHYAWTGDEMAYIDMVASAFFTQQQ
jgi:hypothetical protein